MYKSSLNVFTLNYAGTNILSTNTSLPQDVQATTGGDATFICEFGSSRPSVVSAPLLRFELSLPSEDGSRYSSSTTECQDWDRCRDWNLTSTHPHLTGLSIRPVSIYDRSNFILYHYEVLLTNVVKELNGSVFSCSLSTYSFPKELIQWKRSADLHVHIDPTLPSQAKDDDNGHAQSIIVSVVIIVSILAVAVVATSFLAAVVVWRKRRQQLMIYEPAQGIAVFKGARQMLILNARGSRY